MVNLKQITKETFHKILKLSVHDHQKDQVANNTYSIAQAHVEDHAWIRGIYDDENPVGFVMLALEPDKNEFWVWRYMIDKGEQGKGYGKAGLDLVKEFIKTEYPDAKELFLSYVPKEKDGADGFYLKCGFQDTGKMEEGEKVMKFEL